jgi:hypothetical protein
MLLIPSFVFVRMRDQWIDELKQKIAADPLLSFAYRMGGRLDGILHVFKTCCEKSYIQAQKEAIETYGACDNCKGSGNIIITCLPREEGEEARTRLLFCACPRGKALKEIIDKYYVKKYE